jgi:hypothetical protein
MEVGMSVPDSTLWGKVKGMLSGTILSTADEIHRLIPDSILFGSLLMYVLTLNASYGIFAIFVLESMMSHKFVSWMFNQVSGNSRSISLECRSGYKTPRYDVQRIFSHNVYPSYGTFSIVSMGTYLGLSMGEFRQTLQTMGPEWDSRYGLAIAFIVIVSALFILVRYLKGCESVEELAIASVAGIVIGLLFYFVNSSLFGKEAVNFLGLPYLVDKSSEGSPIYVCASGGKEIGDEKSE